MKYIVTIVAICSTLSVFGQNGNISLKYFINEPSNGDYFSKVIGMPGDDIYEWGPVILDSISIVGDMLRGRLENDTLHPHKRLIYVNKLFLNYSIGCGIESYLVNPDMVVNYADTILMIYDEYVPTVDDSLDYTQLYSQFERQPYYAFLSKSMAAIMVGDYELADYYIGKSKESLNLLDRLKIFKPFFEMVINSVWTLSLSARGECTKSYNLSKKSYDLLSSNSSFETNPNLSEEDNKTLKRAQLDNLEGSLYTLLISSSCIIDSLTRVDDTEQIERHLEGNKKYYLDYQKLIYEKSQLDSLYKLSYNINEIFNNYYILTQDFNIALSNIDEFEKFGKEGGSHLMLELDRIRIYKYIDQKEALIRIEKLLDNPKIYDYVMIGASTLPTQLYTIKGEIYYDQYLLSLDTEDLNQSIKAYENAIDKNYTLKNNQSNLEGIQVLEGVIEPLYNRLSKCYWLKYMVTNELDDLNQSITTGDNSKDFLISQTNNGIFEKGLLKSKYSTLAKKDKYIQGKLYLFQSGLNSGNTNNKNHIDSLLHYKNESKLFMDYIKEKESEYYKAKYVKPVINLEKVKKALDDNTLVLNFICYQDNTLVHIIGKNSIDVVDLPRKREWVNNINELNISLREGGLKKYKKNAPIVYEKLLSPILDAIPDRIERLIIIPDDEMNDLVFDALPIDNTEKEFTYLIEKYAISYQYSLSNFLKSDTRKYNVPDKDFLGFSIEGNKPNLENGKMNCSDTPLDMAREATISISNLFESKKVFINRSDETILKEIEKGAKIIHFAVHGCVGELSNPLNYHLQLSTDKNEKYELSMAEIYNADANSQLIVLSACESGIGQLKRGTGVNSIARAFHYAGCPNTISTTAVVDEKSTTDILFSFYKYLKKGHTIDIALQKAKIDYIKYNKEPYLWANIIFIGNPDKIYFE